MPLGSPFCKGGVAKDDDDRYEMMGFMVVVILLFEITIFHISSNRAAMEVMVVTIKIEWH